MNFTLPAINTATKRKVKQQKKGRATGISPLLSKEEISIVKVYYLAISLILVKEQLTQLYREFMLKPASDLLVLLE